MHTVHTRTVHTASRTYDILIGEGLLDRAGPLCREVNSGGIRALIVTDSHVGPLYAARIASSLQAAGYEVGIFTFPAGEEHKRLETISAIYSQLAAGHFTRTDLLIALGGGVTGDMTGFAAATWLRGMDFVQIPTSLLAQVDSSVGGKTGVDIAEGKNLVGAFRQPARVLVDLVTLDTLPAAFCTDGMAEVIKAGCILDKGLFEDLADGNALSPSRRIDTVTRAIAVKQGVVERDETETGERKLLNFGHTLGHALEQYYHFTGLTHGCAVALGMVAITRASEQQGLTAPGTLDQLIPVLEAYGLPTADPALRTDYLAGVSQDKKRSGSHIDLVVLEELGTATLCRIPFDRLSAFLEGDPAARG